MATKNVKVHTCYSIELGDNRPVPCPCRRFVSATEAEEMIRKGQAQYVLGFDRPKLYDDVSQVCMVGRMKQTPRCATIETTHMERAYLGGDLEEQVRIEMYGFLTLMARVIQGGKFRPIELEPTGGLRNDWGVPVLYLPGEGRTKGCFSMARYGS